MIPTPVFKGMEYFQYQCCGLEDWEEYKISTWRKERLGGDLLVPLTCCSLDNYSLKNAHLNPVPKNRTLCQSEDPTNYETARNTMVNKQGLREGDETDADHRGPRCLGKIRGPRCIGRKKNLAPDFGIFYSH